MSNDSLRPTARKDGLVIQAMPDEVLVFDTATKQASCLNSSAAFIWQHCDGVRSISDIASEFRSQGKGSVTDEFVWLGVDQLKTSALLDSPLKSLPAFDRREIIKRIGLASAIALPIVASLAVPTATMAAASCNCSNNLQCATAPRAGLCIAVTCNVNGICAP